MTPSSIATDVASIELTFKLFSPTGQNDLTISPEEVKNIFFTNKLDGIPDSSHALNKNSDGTYTAKILVSDIDKTFYLIAVANSTNYSPANQVFRRSIKISESSSIFTPSMPSGAV